MSFIATHETVFPAAYEAQLDHFFRLRQGKGLPPRTAANINGTVEAYVNHGRWIVECPHTWTENVDHERSPEDGGGIERTYEVTRSCAHAVIASDLTPYYMCTVCGNEANDGKFYNVVFPANRRAIETELVRRTDRKNASMPYDMPLGS